MEQTIMVKCTAMCCHYRITGSPDWEVVGIRTRTVRRCKFSAYRKGAVQYTLAQTSLLKQVIAVLPIVSFFYTNPFYFIRDGKRCGYGYDKSCPLGQGVFMFVFDGDEYTVVIHSRGIHSLAKNGNQVAVYKRQRDKSYCVRYSQEMERSPDKLILFAAFVENYLTMDTEAGQAPEAYHIPSDQYIDRARWLPEDDAGKQPFL